MLSKTIISRLKERILAPLPQFHKRRIEFWHDEAVFAAFLVACAKNTRKLTTPYPFVPKNPT